MKILSLFDGISCARVALERAGIEVDVYWASEVDKYAIQVATNNYPSTIELGDIKNICWDSRNKIDLLVGGSPCQDLSIAKKNRKGLNGEKSGLFWEYVRLLKETKPKYFILENVASMSKEDKEIITKELGVEPIMINAALVSAQNRKRLFWTNIHGVTLPKDKGILLNNILEDCVDKKYFVNISDKYGNKGLCSINGKSKSMTAYMWKGYGNDDVTTIRVGQIGKGGQGDRIYSLSGKSVGLSALGGSRGAKTGLYHVPHGYKKEKFTQEKKYPTLHAQDPRNNHLICNDIVRKLTPIECERLQGLSDNYTQGISNTQRYKCLGNAFNVDVVAHILSFIPNK